MSKNSDWYEWWMVWAVEAEVEVEAWWWKVGMGLVWDWNSLQ
jgi:hypothetical protein